MYTSSGWKFISSSLLGGRAASQFSKVLPKSNTLKSIVPRPMHNGSCQSLLQVTLSISLSLSLSLQTRVTCSGPVPVVANHLRCILIVVKFYCIVSCGLSCFFFLSTAVLNLIDEHFFEIMFVHRNQKHDAEAGSHAEEL